MEVVQCYINPTDFEQAPKPQTAASTSSRESTEDTPRCRHGKSRRQQNNNPIVPQESNNQQNR